MKISRKAELAILLSTAILNKDSEPEINPFEGVDEKIELVFEPLQEWMTGGDLHQRSRTMYKNVEIIHDVTYPWNIFKRPYDSFTAYLTIPMDTVLPNGGYMYEYYAPEGFGHPNFNTLKDVLDFIDKNPELANNENFIKKD